MSNILTKEEKAWLAGVQRALNKGGSGRLGFYTIGDTDIMVYNKELEDEIDEHQDGGAFDLGECIEAVGADFEDMPTLIFPAPIHSCAG